VCVGRVSADKVQTTQSGRPGNSRVCAGRQCSRHSQGGQATAERGKYSQGGGNGRVCVGRVSADKVQTTQSGRPGNSRVCAGRQCRRHSQGGQATAERGKYSQGGHRQQLRCHILLLFFLAFPRLTSAFYSNKYLLIFPFGVFKNVSIEARLFIGPSNPNISKAYWEFDSPSRVSAANLRRIGGEMAATRVLGRVLPSENERETFSFGFLLILRFFGREDPNLAFREKSIKYTQVLCHSPPCIALPACL
jgi:hypothetical protein